MVARVVWARLPSCVCACTCVRVCVHARFERLRHNRIDAKSILAGCPGARSLCCGLLRLLQGLLVSGAHKLGTASGCILAIELEAIKFQACQPTNLGA